MSYGARGWRIVPLHNPEAGGCSCRKENCGSPAKHPRTKNGLKDASSDEAQIRKWWEMFPYANVGLVTGAESGFFVVDVDEPHGGEESLAALREEFSPLPATVAAITGGGMHYYFMHPGGILHNSAGRVGQGIDTRGDGGYVVAPPSLHPNGRLYAWSACCDPEDTAMAAAPDWLLQKLKSSPLKPVGAPVPGQADMRIPSGSRNNMLTAMGGAMRRRGFPASAILAALLAVNEERCDPMLDPVEVRTIAWSVSRYEPGDPIVVDPGAKIPRNEVSWPKFPLEVGSNLALHGLAGEVVRALDPYTEADPAAILAHFLIFFGNCVGPNPHMMLSGSRHSAKLFAVLVGDSATGRKGTAEAIMRALFEGVDSRWTAHSIRHGLASGEGLIRAFDDVSETGLPKEPRLVVVEQEMVNVLKAMGRDGSTLSGTIRKAWDMDDLEINRSTKKNTLRVNGVHVSIITHITQGELLRALDASQNSNGFANRFLWLKVRRSKSLADAPRVPTVEWNELARKVISAVSFGSETGEMPRTEEASELWREMYPALSSPRPGLAGLVTSRAHVQVLRMALVYALLDQKRSIGPEHLRAGKAFFDFTHECAASIFGNRFGDVVAQRMVSELQESETKEMTRTELYEAIGRNIGGVVIENSLTSLIEWGVVETYRRQRTPDGPKRGPRVEVIRLLG